MPPLIAVFVHLTVRLIFYVSRNAVRETEESKH